MRTKILAALAIVFVLAGAGLAFWARAALGGDTVRNALAGQLSRALGQPVAVGGIATSIFPRLRVSLTDVTIGEPVRIRVNALHLGTGLRALLSRRIEQASVRLEGGRIELPLPPFDFGSSDGAGGSSAVEIVSVEDIALNDIEIVSGGRTLRGDIAAVLEGQRLTLRDASIEADGTRIEASGVISDLTGPEGEVAITAGLLNVDALLAFAGDFSSGLTAAPAAGASPSRAASSSKSSKMNVAVTLEADRATMGEMAIEKLTGRATVTPHRVILDPISFRLFGGGYAGTLAVNLAGETPAFQWKATLSGIDVAAATAFAGSPNTISGRLAGTIDLAGTGADLTSAIRTVRGKGRLEVTDGVVKNLGLVRAIVLATSMRSDVKQDGGSSDEPFTRLSSTVAIANGSAGTDDFRFESVNLVLTAAGTLRLNGRDMNLRGKAQLSDALSAQAGRDLVRYTQEQGRVTLPVSITGPASQPHVSVDTGDMLKRAIRNRAEEEVESVIKKGLGGLIRR